MTDELKNKIIELNKQGYGYLRIGKQLNISPDTVKSFLRREKERQSKKRCLCCGKILQLTPHKKEKKFCSSACCAKWWNSHLDLVKRKAYYTLRCQQCGKIFEVYGNAKQKFCSRKCYAEYRVGRGKNNND